MPVGHVIGGGFGGGDGGGGLGGGDGEWCEQMHSYCAWSQSGAPWTGGAYMYFWLVSSRMHTPSSPINVCAYS